MWNWLWFSVWLNHFTRSSCTSFTFTPPAPSCSLKDLREVGVDRPVGVLELVLLVVVEAGGVEQLLRVGDVVAEVLLEVGVVVGQLRTACAPAASGRHFTRVAVARGAGSPRRGR